MSVRNAMRLAAVFVLLLPAVDAWSQDRFEKLPGYEQYQETRRAMRGMVEGGRVGEIVWREEGESVAYRLGDQWLRYDFATGETREVEESDVRKANGDDDRSRGRGRRVPRGRQAATEESPDGQWIAECEDWNLVIKAAEGDEAIEVTDDGHEDYKYATGSWVYGEELRQRTAMWWSPDSSEIAFYVFDERNVQDFYLTPKLTEVQNQLYVEAYPKPGAANPIVGVLIYDLESGETTRVDIGKDPDQYVYNVRWRPDGSELIFNRTNRHQNVLDVMAADPDTGETRTILTEKQDTWQRNSPMFRWLEDGERFIWESERTGWKHYELRHVDGTLINPLTSGSYPCNSIELVDEDAGWMYYTAYSAKNPLNIQLHRVRLDGSGEARLTEENLSHTRISIAPDHEHFIATAESIETPPKTVLYDTSDGQLATLAEADVSGMGERPMPEMFTFKAADGKTDLYGVLFKPADFDPGKEYPLLIDVYGGPLSQSVRSRFIPANPYCEFGFLIAKIDNRGTENRGKAFESATYLKLGTVDLADQVAGVKHLAKRSYVDGDRVGITGHSYGGYMAALAILKHPDVFHVAVAGASVTDWRNYDTIYTERFMRTPQENAEGYDAGSCMTYADQLEGDLLLLHGMVDDNVHPTNVWQLVHALQEARKPFEMMFFPTSGHGIRSPSINPIKWEFLYEHLIEAPGGATPSMAVKPEPEAGGS